MKKNKLAFRLLGGAIIVAALGWFAYANGGQSVDLDFGLFTLHDLSLPAVVYASVIVGMLLVVGISWRADLRARQALEKYDQIAAKTMPDVPSAEKGVEQQAERKT